MAGPLAPDGTLEVWAGPESTLNRVGDRFTDQLALSGHDTRDSDLELLAWLGVSAVRYPVLWERTAPDGLASARWDWSDRRLGRLRALGVRPIVGLVHHGSGPLGTSLLDPAFPAKLAGYARAVAERYPWIQDWTPLNEPLTTARFSALYGHWYPHARSFPAFARAVLTQHRATVMAMAAIRQVIPEARLVQTEDFGRISGTPAVAVRARADQAQRLLGMDLLVGAVTQHHPLWRDLTRAGVTEAELADAVTAPCPPDIVGVNYYVTSDRFLDDRLARYPPALHGGDGRQRYVDVETVRVADGWLAGHTALLERVWQRYRRPVAVTEVHLACTRDEQLRWFAEAWEGARAARDAGVDVRAVTAWSLLGSFGWSGLAVNAAGDYEPGIFDLRARTPRPTAIAHLVRHLAHGQRYDSPALDAPGWWRRPERVVFPAACAPAVAVSSERTLLVTGGAGTLGQALARVAARRGLATTVLTRRDLDITDPRAVEAVMTTARPWAVLNAAGYVRVDQAEEDAERCWHENVTGAATLACAARAHGSRFATFSSDLVFDGRADSPYDEDATPRPLNVYGTTKAVAEERVLTHHPEALVIRTAAFFGPWDAHNFVIAALRALAAGSTFYAAADLYVSPTFVPDLADAVLDLLLDEARGIWHVANDAAVSWAELAQLAAAKAGLPATGLIRPTPASSLGWRALRPAYSALHSVKGQLLGGLDDALARFVAMAEIPESQRAAHNRRLG